MNQLPYPLLPAASARSVTVSARAVVQALLFDAYAPALAALDTGFDQVFRSRVLLEADPVVGTWRLRWHDNAGLLGGDGAIIGEVAASDRESFATLTTIFDAGYAPLVHATFTVRSSTGVFEVDLHLPPAELAVPRNNVAAMAMVASPGASARINVTQGDFTPRELERLSPGHWFVHLSRVGNAVVATLDERVLGPVIKDDAAAIAALLDSVESLGPDGDAHDVAAHCFLFPASDAGDSSPTEAVIDVGAGPFSHVPPLVAEAISSRAWSVQTLGDGSYAITVDGNAAVDEEDYATPNPEARPVFLPANEVVADVVDKHEELEESRYLSETERVELRRARRAANPDAGRHRYRDED